MLRWLMDSTLGVATVYVLLRLKQWVQQGRIAFPVMLLSLLP